MTATARSNSEWFVALRADGSSAQQAAFGELGHYLQRVLCTYIGRRGRTLPGLAGLARQEQEQLAQEYVQEALVLIYQKLPQYSEEGSFLGWATTVALRLAGEGLRKAHWRSPRFTANEMEEGADDADSHRALRQWVDEASTLLEKQVQLRTILHLVEQCIVQELSEQQRQAFLARFVDGQSNEEIALAVGASPSVVYQRIHQARKKLKQRLNEAGYNLNEFL
jgi:RNA polymerase sigma factor (sigma-70 family)